MSGLAVRIDIADAVREAQAAFEAFGVDRFPRAVQFALTGVAIEAVNQFRAEIPHIWHSPNKATRDALRYTVDRDFLNRVATVGDAKASVFVQDLQSIWLKYSFGDGPQTRPGGDVGVEAYFADQTNVAIPVGSNLRKTGLGKPAASGKVPARDARRIAAMAAAGYDRNTAGGTKGSGSWGVFEIKAGDTSRQHGFYTGPGIYARPPRVVAAVGRKRVAKAIKAGRMAAPTTTFARRNGQSVTVPKVVNADVPRMLFLRTPKAEYKPVASPSWDRAMQRAADTMADRLAAELADRLDHLGLR
ncbi:MULTISPECIES: hypothetical protein [unclassified Methylobacterium]|uniref:hypothetical protein n=1 Tax=unclassified Methylobacterium TaxID=2615210 RepID=UPI000CB119AF|nr:MULTISPECIES: hypothetical protein [unclassified Methylobacterium]PIU06637.1 MAG: hypothetical protein COT56_08370 [Methylobacterium sp. CG09_land_8_20_14_0_10_71_15]PIU12103.1 MAG: hypothetical protein COT28_16875 [Methylobacterium sp. CG08_land_8_20_14_0_20_71_15]GBU19683.1 hypothetical protein AwMethylo_38980 [Methylobacterium sp.]